MYQARSLKFADEQAFPLSELGEEEVEDVSPGLVCGVAFQGFFPCTAEPLIQI